MSDSQRWLLVAGLVLGGWLLYLLAPVLTPFLIAALLAYMGDPLADRLQGRGLTRTWAVVVVFVLMFLLGLIALLLLLPMLEQQISALVRKLPAYLDWLEQHALPAVSGVLGMEAAEIPDLGRIKDLLRQQWQQAGGLAVNVLQGLSASGVAFLLWLGNLVLVPVVTFYLLRDWDLLVQRARALLPRRWESAVVEVVSECDEVLSAFFRGQLLVMLALGVMYTAGLALVGLDLAVLIGFAAGLVSFVPYLGVILGGLAAGAAALVQFQDWLHLLYVALVFGAGQLVEGMLLTPYLVGGRIGLHPVAVIFAVLAGGQLFGFFGVLLALPAAAVVMVLLRYMHRRYLASAAYEP